MKPDECLWQEKEIERKELTSENPDIDVSSSSHWRLKTKLKLKRVKDDL